MAINQHDTPDHPLAQRLNIRNECVRSWQRDCMALKARIKDLEESEKAMAQLKSESDPLQANLTEWTELSIKIDLLEKQVQGLVDAEKDKLRGKLVKRDDKIREL